MELKNVLSSVYFILFIFFFKKTQKDRASKGGSSPKGKPLHSPSPSSRLNSPYQSKKTTKFELKDNLPVAGNIKK